MSENLSRCSILNPLPFLTVASVSIPIESSLALASERPNRVGASSKRVAIVISSQTFVQICNKNLRNLLWLVFQSNQSGFEPIDVFRSHFGKAFHHVVSSRVMFFFQRRIRFARLRDLEKQE